jgi:hypothetical protein
MGRETSVHTGSSRTFLGLGSDTVTSSPAITTMLDSDGSASPELLADQANLLASVASLSAQVTAGQWVPR